MGVVNWIPVLNQEKEKNQNLGRIFLVDLLAGSFGVYLCLCALGLFYSEQTI